LLSKDTIQKIGLFISDALSRLDIKTKEYIIKVWERICPRL